MLGNSRYFFLSRTTAAFTQGKSISKSLLCLPARPVSNPTFRTILLHKSRSPSLITLRLAPGAEPNCATQRPRPLFASLVPLQVKTPSSPSAASSKKFSHFHACLYNLSFQRLLSNLFALFKADHEST